MVQQNLPIPVKKVSLNRQRLSTNMGPTPRAMDTFRFAVACCAQRLCRKLFAMATAMVQQNLPIPVKRVSLNWQRLATNVHPAPCSNDHFQTAAACCAQPSGRKLLAMSTAMDQQILPIPVKKVPLNRQRLSTSMRLQITAVCCVRRLGRNVSTLSKATRQVSNNPQPTSTRPTLRTDDTLGCCARWFGRFLPRRWRRIRRCCLSLYTKPRSSEHR